MHCRHGITAIILMLFILLAGPLSTPAQAAINEKGARHLQSLFEDMLSQSDGLTKDDLGGLKLDGTVMVERANGYYAVTLPHISYMTADNKRIDIGIISLNVMPGEDKQQWKMTMAMPSPITVYDEKNAQLASLTIGQQYFAGVWHEKLQSYTKLKAQYKNIALRMTDSTLKITVPDTTIIYDLTENAKHLWSGPSSMTVNGLKVKTPDGSEITVGKIESIASITDYSLETAAAYRDNMQALNESYEAGEGSESAQHIAGVYNLVTEFIGSVWNGFETSINISDIHFFKPMTDKEQAREFKLSKVGYAFDMMGFRSNNVTLRMATHYDGLSIKPLPPEFDETAPTRVNLDFSIKNMPYKDIIALGKTSVETAVQAPQMAKLVGLQALMSLPDLFTKAGTTLEIKNSFAENDIYRALLNARLQADLTAMKGGVGTGRIEISGLEKLLTVTAEQMKKTDLSEEEKNDLKKTAATLTVMQMIGKMSKDNKNKPIRLYDLELTKEGSILLNGADMSTLLGQNNSEDGKDDKSNKEDKKDQKAK